MHDIDQFRHHMWFVHFRTAKNLDIERGDFDFRQQGLAA